MELFIRLKNGQPFEHPIFGDNFRLAFPSIDTANLPDTFAYFERVQRPTLDTYQINEGVSYQWIDGKVKDVWSTRDMTTEEISAKQQEVKDAWAALPNRDNFAAWTFNEITCAYQPPTPRPAEGNVFWQGTTLTWVNRPEYPTDGKTYKLDFASATWVEVTP